MNTVSKIIAGSFAFYAAFAQAAMAGNAYEAGPTVADNGADAGILLLVAIGAILVIKSIVNPSPSQDAGDDSQKKE